MWLTLFCVVISIALGLALGAMVVEFLRGERSALNTDQWEKAQAAGGPPVFLPEQAFRNFAIMRACRRRYCCRGDSRLCSGANSLRHSTTIF